MAFTDLILDKKPYIDRKRLDVASNPMMSFNKLDYSPY